MSPCCVAARDFDINSSVTDSENSSMHECVRETPLRFPIALLYLRALLWRSIDSIGGLSRLSTNHGVCCTSSPCGFSHCRISGDYIFARARFCFSKTAPLAPASGIGQGSLLVASTETVLVAFIPSCMTNDDWI